MIATTTQKFVPLIDVTNIIREVDVGKVLKLTAQHYKIDGSVNLQQYLGHTMNFGNPRYQQFVTKRRCACCNIAITHAFLEYDPDNKDENGDPLVVFNFYAETKDKPENDTSYLILLTHSKPHNATVCATCGWATNSLNCSIFELQQSLFNVYRIYRSSLTLRYSDAMLAPAFRELTKNEKLIANVTQGLTKAKPEYHPAMQEKIDIAEARIKELEPRIDAARVQSQQTGVSVSEEQVKLM